MEDLMAIVPHVDRGASPEKITGELQEHGAVIIEGLLDAGTLERFNAELDPLLEATSPRRDFVNPAIGFFFGDKTRHLTGMAAKSRVFAEEILPHATYMGVCDAVLGPACASYQVNIAHVLDRGPGAEQQLLHRDELVWSHLPRPHPEIQLASIIALVDFSADIGATRLVPGSHKWPKEREPQPDEIAVAEMPAGSAVIYLGSTIHGGGPNCSENSWRRGMHISYTVGWLRTEENQCLSVPPEVARTLPRRSQELLGYDVHDAIQSGGGYLGTVDLVAPVDLLAEGRLG
jgi:ectoine hydroxylase-related dioxygenase (phytanoyl-CoA dioxygenase family)